MPQINEATNTDLKIIEDLKNLAEKLVNNLVNSYLGKIIKVKAECIKL